MHQTIEDERVVLDEAFNFEIPCEGPQAWPEALGHCDQPARWIGLKKCGHHRLFCDDCKEFYIARMEQFSHFTCGVCGEGGSMFIGFELIDRARH